MKRIAFKMFLKPGFEEEYKKRHHEIWPELKKLLSNSGVSNYSIFLDKETNFLFAVQNMHGEKSSQELSCQHIVQKWWNYMADIMEVNNDNSPISISLEEMFYME